MFNGSRFFNLARKWKKEEREDIYTMHFRILQDVMDHYFGCIAGYSNYTNKNLTINSLYPVADIAFVLDAVGYRNYSIQRFEKIGKTLVTLRNTL